MLRGHILDGSNQSRIVAIMVEMLAVTRIEGIFGGDILDRQSRMIRIIHRAHPVFNSKLVGIPLYIEK
jgi:hypothetical protein